MNKGFSLAEVLMALGILSIGMIFIAAVFPAGVQFATISTERTIAAVVADEAFAKINLYAKEYMNDSLPLYECGFFPMNNATPFNWPMDEFAYPSDPNINIKEKIYCWSAIWRRLPYLEDPSERNVQVTVFVCRKAGLNSNYYWYNSNANKNEPWPSPVIPKGPTPVPVEITAINGNNHITITENVKCPLEQAITFLTEGCTIVDGLTGFLYRVLKHDDTDHQTIILDRVFSGSGTRDVWVVPPPVNGGRYPCIAVYQKMMRF
jgi:prepilin-type N-terminal cleavage/methylation domain-containing protein